MFAHQTLLFISLSPERQLPNGIFVLRAFSNGLHTSPVCSPRRQHLTTPRGVAIKPLRASSVASCHLPRTPHPLHSVPGMENAAFLLSFRKGLFFAGLGRGVRSPLITRIFLIVSFHNTPAHHAAFSPTRQNTFSL